MQVFPLGTFANGERRDEMCTAAAKEETGNVDYNLGDAEKLLGVHSFSAPHMPSRSDAISMILSTENQTPFDSELEGLDSRTLSERGSAIYSLFDPNYDSALVTLGSCLGSGRPVAN